MDDRDETEALRDACRIEWPEALPAWLLEELSDIEQAAALRAVHPSKMWRGWEVVTDAANLYYRLLAVRACLGDVRPPDGLHGLVRALNALAVTDARVRVLLCSDPEDDAPETVAPVLVHEAASVGDPDPEAA